MFGLRLHIPLLITGHPRCGTTSAGAICRSYGLDVGDEGVGRHGACSWMLAVDDKWSPYGSDKDGRSRRGLRWDNFVLVVRNLRDAVPSVMTENRFAAPSLQYRRKHILKQCGIDLNRCPDELSAALQSILCWVRIISEQKPDLWFRIEDQQECLREFLRDRFPVEASHVIRQGAYPTHENAKKAYGGAVKPKPELTPDDWNRLPSNILGAVEWYCTTFGYPNPVGE